MKNTIQQSKYEEFLEDCICCRAFAAVGLGSYKAYGSYTAANMSEEDLLLSENIEALSSPEFPNQWIDCTWAANTHCAFTGAIGCPAFDRPDATYIWLVVGR